MPQKSDSSRKHRKSRSIKKDANQYFPSVTFEGAESVDIPADEGKSPVSTHMSLCSNPADFKFMDEIALLKRGRIDRDAPKHPYDRRGNEQEEKASKSITSSFSSNSVGERSPAMTLMGGTVENERCYSLGNNGQLKHWQMKEGGERYEVSTVDEQITVYQQCEGQTCLFTFKM